MVHLLLVSAELDFEYTQIIPALWPLFLVAVIPSNREAVVELILILAFGDKGDIPAHSPLFSVLDRSSKDIFDHLSLRFEDLPM